MHTMKFTRTPRTFELKWIPETDWRDVCTRRTLIIRNHPQESLIGLAYNNENQVVQVTRNSHKSHALYYVTLLENQQANRSLLSTRSHMTVEYVNTRLYEQIEVAEYNLLDVHVRQEGLGERGLLLEAFIQDVQNKHRHYRVSGNFEIVTHHGLVSKDCFTRYGFKLHQHALVLQNFDSPLLVT